MNVIDKILNEWSFRCHDGIVDMNDPKKVIILNEILADYNLDEQEKKSYEELSSELKDEMLNLSYNEKLKILGYIKKVKSKEEEDIKNIEKELNSKQIPEDILDLIVLRSEKRDLINQLKNLINSTSLEELDKKGQLKVDSDLGWINNLTATQSSLSLGKGEILLTIMLKGAILAKEGKYDIEYQSKQIEVKQGNISGNKVYGAIISPQGRSSNYKTIWDKKVEGDESFKDKYFKNQKTELSTWTPIFNYYNQNPSQQNQFLTDLNSSFSAISKEKIESSDFKDPQTFYKKIAYLVTGDYLKDNKILILMNSNLNYLVLDEKEYKDAILNNKDIYANNAFIPRIAYGQKPADEETEEIPSKPELPQEKNKIDVPKEKVKAGMVDSEWFNNQDFPPEIKSKFETFKDEDEKNWYKLTDKAKETTRLKITEELTNYLLELFNTDHFQLRVNERGNVLDILNLKDIPLKDYNPSEVKEKLKLNISSELKSRAETLLGKDIPSSNTYDVGIKVLKPVLNVDGKKYPLNLFAISTKEIKDKDGNVTGIREIENKGTLYFATVVDNKITTLLLLDKEDDNDLYFQIKKHTEQKTGEKKEAKILTPPSYVYEIDLDELMGAKKDQGPIIIDPSTLPYKVRTDYRIGANFDHEKFGTGKIVATSAGSGGKGDSRGALDWVDVKYPKPFLKGGKLTDIRRFDNIITLASPLLAK